MTTISTEPATEYWTVDCPGLNASSAAALVALAQSLPGVVGPTAVDPARWFSRNLDVSTVDALMNALRYSLELGELPIEVRDVVEPVVEDMEAWRRSRYPAHGVLK